MAGSHQPSFWKHVKLQFLYHKKQTFILLALVSVWGLLLARNMVKPNPKSATARTVASVKIAELQPTAEPNGSEVAAPVLIASWSGIHREILRDPFTCDWSRQLALTIPSDGTHEGSSLQRPSDTATGSNNEIRYTLKLLGTRVNKKNEIEALINGRFYHVGQTIGEFMIQDIYEDAVRLNNGTESYWLNVGESITPAVRGE